MKILHNSWDYFTEKTLKNGDLFSYGIGTTAKDVMLKAKKLGGLLQYVQPSDPDYKYGNGGLTLRVVIPLP